MYYCSRKENNLHMIHCTAHKSGEHEKGKKEIPELLKRQCNRLLDDNLAGLVHECTPRMLLAFLLFLSWFSVQQRFLCCFCSDIFHRPCGHLYTLYWPRRGPFVHLHWTLSGRKFQGKSHDHLLMHVLICSCRHLSLCFFSVIWAASRMCLLQRLAVSSFTWKVQQEVTVWLHLEVTFLYTVASKSYDYHHLFSVHNAQSEGSHMGPIWRVSLV